MRRIFSGTDFMEGRNSYYIAHKIKFIAMYSLFKSSIKFRWMFINCIIIDRNLLLLDCRVNISKLAAPILSG